MVPVFRTMRCAQCESIDRLSYGKIYSTPKIDGVRVACHPFFGPVSNSSKTIPNLYIRKWLNNKEFSGLDGEIIYGETNTRFNETSSAVMSQYGPDTGFTYHVFDIFTLENTIYSERLEYLKSLKISDQNIKIVSSELISSKQELLENWANAVSLGYEGIVLRHAERIYKHGRSTFREGGMIKLKHFSDIEAVVVGFVEKLTNNNTPTINEMGLQTRSHHKENKVPAGMLGALICRNSKWKETFEIGSGFTQQERIHIWGNQEKYLGKLVKFKYFPYGELDRPRHPTFLGWRHHFDM